jgi:hypothetical protein
MLYVVVLVWIHFIGDFVLQSDKMAINKSKSNRWLLAHVFTYSLPFALFGWKFVVLTFCFHCVTDYFTSRGTSYLWTHEKRHWFFVLIGFDQAIHLTTLFLTYQLLRLQTF